MLSFWKEKKRILLFLFIFTMILPLVRAQFYDLFPNIGEIYTNSFVWFDFFIYLAIFGTLTKAVFEKRFESAANALAIGIGIAMSMSLVLWEDWQGQSLFMIGKWWALIVALVFVFFVIYTFIYDRTRKKALAIVIASILVLILLYLIGIASGIGGIPNNLMDYVWYGVGALAVALLLYLVFRDHRHVPKGFGGVGGGGGGVIRPQTIRQPPYHEGMQPEEPEKPKPEEPKSRPEEPNKTVLPSLINIQRYLNFIVENCIRIAYQSGAAYNVVHNNKKVMVAYPKDLARLQASTTKIVTLRPRNNDYNQIRNISRALVNPNITEKERRSALILLENVLVRINNNLTRILSNRNELSDVNMILEKHIQPNLKFPKRVESTNNICVALLRRAAEIRKRMP